MTLERKEIIRNIAALKNERKSIDLELTKLEQAMKQTPTEDIAKEIEALEKKFDAIQSKLDIESKSLKRKNKMKGDSVVEDSVEDDDEDDDEDDEEDSEDEDEDDEENDKKKSKKKKSLAMPNINRIPNFKMTDKQAFGVALWARLAKNTSEFESKNEIYERGIKGFGRNAGDLLKMGLMSKAEVGAVTTYNTQNIFQDWDRQFIQMLNTQAVVRRAGATVHQMPNGQLTIPRRNVGLTAYYVGEGVGGTFSTVAMDTLNLNAKKLTALCYTTIEAFQFPQISVADQITDELVTRIALREDNAFLQGTGVGLSPTGITNLVNANNKLASSLISNAVTFQSVSNDIASMKSAVFGNMVDPEGCCWVMNYNVKVFLENLSSTLGVYPFANDLEKNTLRGFPVFTTQQLSTAGGATQVLFGKMSDVHIGDAYGVQMLMSDTASFNDGGTVRSSFGESLMAFRANKWHDMVLAHDVSFAVMNTTNWVTTAGEMSGTDLYNQAVSNSATSASGAVGTSSGQLI